MVEAPDRLHLPMAMLSDFCRRNAIIELALFGSALRDDFGPDSDLDLLVSFAPDAQIGFMALGRMERELSAILERKVDLVPRPGLHSLIRDEVLAKRRVLYAAP